MNNGLRKASSISTAATSATASLPTSGPSIGNGLRDIVSSKSDALFDRKISLATEGLQPFLVSRLKKLPQENALTIVDYIISMKNEINLSDNYRKLNIYTLYRMSKFLNNKKTYKEFTREDLLQYLDSFRRPEGSDPHLEQRKRPKGKLVVENIPMLKRKEQSIYKPSDLWTLEDDLLFLKYCPSLREKCYHTMSRDLSCRPHEILKLRLKDVQFKNNGNYQYAEVLLNGKTGSRTIPLIDSIPYLKDWMDQHPQTGNPNSPLICGLGKTLGRRLTANAVYQKYINYREKVFPKLLDNPSIPPEDKQKIRELLKKPWNPYIRRHSALTEKSTILKENVLRQHAGWSIGSQMPQKYLHYFGNESSESLLEAYGIIPKNQQIDQLKPKQCPNCSEPNKPGSKFCAKCRMILTYDAYNETIENKKEKDDAYITLSDQVMKLMTEVQELKRGRS